MKKISLLITVIFLLLSTAVLAEGTSQDFTTFKTSLIAAESTLANIVFPIASSQEALSFDGIDTININGLLFSRFALEGLLYSGDLSKIEIGTSEVVLTSPDGRFLVLTSNDDANTIIKFVGDIFIVEFNDLNLDFMDSESKGVIVDYYGNNNFITLISQKDNLFYLPFRISESVYITNVSSNMQFSIDGFLKIRNEPIREGNLKDINTSIGLILQYDSLKNIAHNSLPIFIGGGFNDGITFKDGHDIDYTLSIDKGSKGANYQLHYKTISSLEDDGYYAARISFNETDVDFTISDKNNFHLASFNSTIVNDDSFKTHPQIDLYVSKDSFVDVQVYFNKDKANSDGTFNEKRSYWTANFCEGKLKINPQTTNFISATNLDANCQKIFFETQPGNESLDTKEIIEIKNKNITLFNNLKSEFGLISDNSVSITKGQVGINRKLTFFPRGSRFVAYFDDAGKVDCLYVPGVGNNYVFSASNKQLQLKPFISTMLVFSENSVENCRSHNLINDGVIFSKENFLRSTNSSFKSHNEISDFSGSYPEAYDNLSKLIDKGNVPLILLKDNFDLIPLGNPVHIRGVKNGAEFILSTIVQSEVAADLTTGSIFDAMESMSLIEDNIESVGGFNLDGEEDLDLVIEEDNTLIEELNTDIINVGGPLLADVYFNSESSFERTNNNYNAVAAAVSGTVAINNQNNAFNAFTNVVNTVNVVEEVSNPNNVGTQNINSLATDDGSVVITNGRSNVIAKKEVNYQDLINKQQRKIFDEVAKIRGVNYENIRQEWRDGKINAFALTGNDVYADYPEDVAELNRLVNINRGLLKETAREYNEIQEDLAFEMQDGRRCYTELLTVRPEGLDGYGILLMHMSDLQAMQYGANAVNERDNIIHLLLKANDLSVPVMVVETTDQEVLVYNDGETKKYENRSYNTDSEIMNHQSDNWNIYSVNNHMRSAINESEYLLKYIDDEKIDKLIIAGWDQHFGIKKTIIDLKNKRPNIQIYTSFDIIQGSSFKNKVTGREAKQNCEESIFNSFEEGTSVCEKVGRRWYNTSDADARNGNNEGEIMASYSPEALLKFYQENTTLKDTYMHIPLMSMEIEEVEVTFTEEVYIEPVKKEIAPTLEAEETTPKIDSNEEKIAKLKSQMTKKIDALCEIHFMQVDLRGYSTEETSDMSIACQKWNSNKDVRNVDPLLQYTGYETDLKVLNSLSATSTNTVITPETTPTTSENRPHTKPATELSKSEIYVALENNNEAQKALIEKITEGLLDENDVWEGDDGVNHFLNPFGRSNYNWLNALYTGRSDDVYNLPDGIEKYPEYDDDVAKLKRLQQEKQALLTQFQRLSANDPNPTILGNEAHGQFAQP